MATQQEEVRIKIGVDKRSVERDLTSVEDHFRKSVTKMGKDLIKLNVASLIGGNLLDVWDKATQKLASLIHNVGQYGQAKQAFWRREYQDFLKQVEAEKQAEEKRLKDIKERDVILDRASDADKKRQLLAEKDEAKRAAMSRRFLTDELKALRESLDIRGNMVDQAKTQLAIAQKELEVAQLSNAEAAEKAALLEKVKNAQGGVESAKSNVAASLRELSDVSLGEATSLVGISADNLPGLRFSRQQIADIQRAQLLQRQAQQARIFGNEQAADALSRQRIDLLNRNKFLAEMDRNPLKVAEEQLAIAKQTLELAQGGGLAVKVKVSKR